MINGPKCCKSNLYMLYSPVVFTLRRNKNRWSPMSIYHSSYEESKLTMSIQNLQFVCNSFKVLQMPRELTIKTSKPVRFGAGFSEMFWVFDHQRFKLIPCVWEEHHKISCKRVVWTPQYVRNQPNRCVGN